MTDSELQKAALQSLAKYITMAEKRLGAKFRPNSISFRLRGTGAGKVTAKGPSKDAFLTLKLNMHFLRAETHDMLHQTIPHELCHIIQVRVGRKIAHDGYFYWLMREVMGIRNVKNRHSYDISHVWPYQYACACSELHHLSPLLHRRVSNGQVRRCRRCGYKLTYVGVVKKGVTNVAKG